MLFLLAILLACLMLAVVVLVRVLLGRSSADPYQVAGPRGMFRYSDGKTVKAIDPIRALIELEAHERFRFDLHPRQAATGDTEALTVIADAVRKVFDVPPYTAPTQAGLTIRECHELLCAFVLYCDHQKKTTEPTLTSAPSTESTSSDSENLTTPPTLAST